MKLSDFLKTKKIIFRNGKVESVSSITDGDIEFYELDAQKLTDIKENIVDKITEEYSEEIFLYQILPYICNIEVDVDLETFKKMTESPSVEFTYVIESIIDVVNNIFDLADRTNELTNKIEEIKEKRPEIFTKEETIEEKIIRLTEEMNKEEDIDKKKEIFRELAKLYEEVENNE